MFKRLLAHKFFWPALLLLFIVPTYTFLLKPGLYWNMHDDMQLIRQYEMDKCLKDGQIPCRWTPDLGFGYGYPLFNFYPPLPYIVGESIHLLGFNLIWSVKISIIILIIASALAMYALGGRLVGPIGGFLAGLAYSFAPYHAVNIYVRGAINEAWASLFFPLIFLFSYEFFRFKTKTRYLFLLSLSWSGLLLSHNPMALTFAFFFIPWCLYVYFHFYKKILFKPIFRLSLAGLLALGLSAFYTLPVLFESKLVQIDSMFQNYYHFSVHFVSLRQLFLSQYWGDGPSVWGAYDGMSFALGPIFWLIPLILLFYFLYLSFKKKTRHYFLPILIVLLALTATFMAHERSAFLWLWLKPIQKIQFPWRFLNHSLFLFSLAFAFIPRAWATFSQKTLNLLAPLLGVVIVLLNYKFFFPVVFGPLTIQEKFSGLAWTNQVTSGIYDYLPKTASTAAKTAAKTIIDEVDPPKTDYELLSYEKGSDWWLFNLKNGTPARFTLASLYFPNFEVTDNFKPLTLSVEPLLGRIVLELPSGEHQLYLKLQNTPIRNLGNSLSLFSWILLNLYFIRSLWLKLK